MHVAWETVPFVYCQQCYKLYVNAMNHTVEFHSKEFIQGPMTIY